MSEIEATHEPFTVVFHLRSGEAVEMETTRACARTLRDLFDKQEDWSERTIGFYAADREDGGFLLVRRAAIDAVDAEPVE